MIEFFFSCVFTTMFIHPCHSNLAYDDSNVEKICAFIVKLLEEKKWNVEGIKVKFRQRNRGDAKHYCVYCIQGCNFKLFFDRLDPYYEKDTYCVGHIFIPKKALSLYTADSLTYTKYIGDQWEADKQLFESGLHLYNTVPAIKTKCETYHRP